MLCRLSLEVMVEATLNLASEKFENFITTAGCWGCLSPDCHNCKICILKSI